MNMKKNKICMLVLITLVIIFGLGIWKSFYIDGQAYHLEVVHTNNGYGYQIKHGEQMVVYQPFVPVISQRKPFRNAEEAVRVGGLVLERLKAGQGCSVTEEDLKRLGIGNK